MKFKKLIISAKRWYSKRSSQTYIQWLRKQGVKIGEGTIITVPRQIDIDVSRPSLLTIGSNCRLNAHMTIMTHDAAAKVFRGTKGEFINSSGHINIGNNVYFGRYTTVLKGVTIGDNCIIGYGSVVMKDIPANSVAVGTPAKVISTLDDYYERRKKKALEEAFEYVRSIQERFNRRPEITDLKEEFIYFVDSTNLDNYPQAPAKYQLGPGYEQWLKNHKAMFKNMDDFLAAAGIK